MIEDSALKGDIAALNQYFLGEATMSETLTKVSKAAVIALPQADFVGITMMVDQKIDTYVFTHSEIPEIDRAQYESGHGPCVDARRDSAVHTITDTRTDRRWPEFSAVAHEHGILSTLSLPMIAGERTIGAMNLYSTQPNGFSEDDERLGWFFAAQAAFLLANVQAYWDSRSLSENLVAALESRAVIEQAKGIIIASRGGTADDAFETPVAQSQHEQRKVRELAAEIVRNAARPTR